MGYCDYEREQRNLREEQRKIKQQIAKKKKQEEREKEFQKREFMRALGDSIADARKKSKMSLEKVAKKIDVNPEYLKELEEGKRDITILNLIDLGIVFNKSFTEFMKDSSFTFMLRMHMND